MQRDHGAMVEIHLVCESGLEIVPITALQDLGGQSRIAFDLDLVEFQPWLDRTDIFLRAPNTVWADMVNEKVCPMFARDKNKFFGLGGFEDFSQCVKSSEHPILLRGRGGVWPRHDAWRVTERTCEYDCHVRFSLEQLSTRFPPTDYLAAVVAAGRRIPVR